ncbi:Crp/Fnr family transcriptional regulator [Paracoccus sp. TOH]|uniref:Crp/Fnr family transcriptional regulator n=1 Tax=Paracoccus simplex TaxID=2086346 RepID=A0ABV7RWM7_9RHOB|nr:Crp/Fnr family transcriptional regulator [Paracoccus sp. TOH]WJS84261.1 Crp/Fnr family transcriptional regulator [Paracoccus sp. TOH]
MSAPLTPALRQIASQSRLFSTMPPALSEQLLDQARVVQYQRGAPIFYQGDIARALHIVAEGWVKLYRLSPGGTEAVVGTMTRGQSFGEPIALRRAAYPVSAEASTDCRLIALPSDALLSALKSRPEAAISIIASTFQHLQALVEQIEELKARSGTQRVAGFLLELCPEGAEDRATVTLPYDKALIAGRLGMKPESLSRAFARLRDHGVQIRQNSAEIGSIPALREVVEGDPGDAWSR